MPVLHPPAHAACDQKICRSEENMSISRHDFLVSRRDFLKTSGALVVSFSAASLAGPFALAQGPFDTHPSHVDPKKLDSWIAVATDGTVTAYTGKCDFGQGMFTVQTQLVAEELCVPLGRVKLIQPLVKHDGKTAVANAMDGAGEAGARAGDSRAHDRTI